MWGEKMKLMTDKVEPEIDKMTSNAVCKSCNGNGLLITGSDQQYCLTCNGTGQMYVSI
ncbi:hypothetical protein KP78_25210 [Jeotgalibacillus soli]|uniref:Uncharacterized protein n=2 Tax=Jeotgalibacillus soli TaxID=889306 RepID=A0A0C2V7P4_9BACL|nr:hypothetical protein KP78_25210 [Jeotgalibacillus soli]